MQKDDPEATRKEPVHVSRPQLGMDPIRFEVMRSAFQSAAEEMAIALRRAAYSTNIKTRADFSCALYDEHLRVVAQAFSQPIHLASMVRMIPAAVREYGPQRLQPGDGLAMNDPHLGAMHLNDIGMIVPLFHEERCVGYAANVAHHVDIGGLAPGGLCISKDIYQEGVIIPPTKILQDGQIIENVFQLIAANVRSPRQMGGDFRAQVASALLGGKRVTGLYDRFGSDNIQKFNDELMEYTRRWTKSAISKLPRGEYRAACELDDDGLSDVNEGTGDDDGDGVPNYLDPLDKDDDDDGLSNDREDELGTDPNDPDSDDDGLPDGDEVQAYIWLPPDLISQWAKASNDWQQEPVIVWYVDSWQHLAVALKGQKDGARARRHLAAIDPSLIPTGAKGAGKPGRGTTIKAGDQCRRARPGRRWRHRRDEVDSRIRRPARNFDGAARGDRRVVRAGRPRSHVRGHAAESDRLRMPQVLGRVVVRYRQRPARENRRRWFRGCSRGTGLGCGLYRRRSQALPRRGGRGLLRLAAGTTCSWPRWRGRRPTCREMSRFL